jgi:leader peptidase (prepilin peptidase)/N-methyltransferase
MTLILLAFAFVLGACIGSFLNVVIVRLPREESLYRRRSHCMACAAPIAAYDNLPIISYLLLRGRCRACGARFSARYAVVELLTALFFAVTFYYRFGDVVACLDGGAYPPWHVTRAAVVPWLSDCVLGSTLLAMTAIDAVYLIIPMEITATGFLAGFALSMAYPAMRDAATLVQTMAACGIALSVGGGLLMLVRWLGALWFKREALGLGDVHLMLMLAMFMNWPQMLLTIFLSALLGSVGGIVMKLAQRRVHWRFEIPYGPYIAAAALVAYFWGGALMRGYLHLCGM